jgi:enoyl-CoA hydratase/carnithine racemase
VSQFEEYKDKYANARMRRDDGILELTLHTDGDSLVWSESAHRELGYALYDIGADRENRIVILTGAGERFCAQIAKEGWGDIKTPTGRDKIYWEGKRLHMNLLNVEVPVIAAVNGPAHTHAELAVMCDIVLASSTATFQDGHFVHGRVPGDGVHVVWPLLLGLNRGKYFQLTGQILGADEAQALGVVNEVLPPDQLLGRAWEIARVLSAGSTLLLRYSRVALNMHLQRLMHADIGYGLLLENMGAVDDNFKPEMLPLVESMRSERARKS